MAYGEAANFVFVVLATTGVEGALWREGAAKSADEVELEAACEIWLFPGPGCAKATTAMAVDIIIKSAALVMFFMSLNQLIGA